MADIQISTQLRQHYADHYDSGPNKWRWLCAVDKAAHIVDLCSARPHDTILEIGAGDGSILRRLSDVGFGRSISALEVSQTGVETIRRAGFNCSLFDGYAIPHADKSFDLAVLSHVIEHVEHPRMLLYEAARVAKAVFVEVPLEDNMRLRRNFVMDRTGHINFYSARTIRLLMQSSGLIVLRESVTNMSKDIYRHQKGFRGAVNYHIKQALLRVSQALATGLFTYHYSAVCESGHGADDPLASVVSDPSKPRTT